MKFPYVLLLDLLLLADIFAFTEVAALLRKPSDASVMLGPLGHISRKLKALTSIVEIE